MSFSHYWRAAQLQKSINSIDFCDVSSFAKMFKSIQDRADKEERRRKRREKKVEKKQRRDERKKRKEQRRLVKEAKLSQKRIEILVEACEKKEKRVKEIERIFEDNFRNHVIEELRRDNQDITAAIDRSSPPPSPVRDSTSTRRFISRDPLPRYEMIPKLIDNSKVIAEEEEKKFITKCLTRKPTRPVSLALVFKDVKSKKKMLSF